MIDGRLDELGRALVRCRIFLPRLSRAGSIWFQVDTGADVSCLHPSGNDFLEVPFDLLNHDRAGLVGGVGGQTRYFPEQAQLIFEDDDWGYVVHTIDLWIAEPNSRNRALNSLLGLDILSQWRMNFDPRNDLLQFFA